MRSSALILGAAIMLTACGWQLRGAQVDEQGLLPAIQIVSDDNYSPMVRTLRETWDKQSVKERSALYLVQILEEVVDRRPVTYTTTGTPAQYEMTVTLTYAVQLSGATAPKVPRTISTHRIFDFDPRNVVAKAEEERALLQHMRQQLAQTLLNDVARLHHRESRNSNESADDTPSE